MRLRRKPNFDLLAHRTAMGVAPENTLAGIRAAKRQGCKAVEFDVRLTADLVPVLMHDTTVDRTTDSEGDVAKLAFADLATLDAAATFGESAFAGEPVPSLAEALVLCAELGLQPHIEIKSDRRMAEATAHAVVQTLELYWDGSDQRPVISSFEPRALDTVSRLAPVEFDRALLLGAEPGDWRRRAVDLGVSAIHADADSLTEPLVDAIKEAGYELRAYTVNNAEQAKLLRTLGVDGVFCDAPAELRKAMGPWPPRSAPTQAEEIKADQPPSP